MCGTGGGFNPNACTPHSNSLARGSHSKPHALQCIAAQDGTWHRGTPGRGQVSLPPTPRDRHPDPGMDATPPRCPRCAGRWPPPSIWGQAGDRSGQPSSAKCEGQPSPRPVVALQACILGLQMSMCCPHVSRTPPSPGTKLLRGGPLLLPRLSVPPPPGVMCGQGHHFCPILFFT